MLAGAVLTVGTLVVAAPSGCARTPADMPAPGPAVRLTATVPAGLSIGVVVSVTSAPGEGSAWRDAAEGARVAAERFALGGTSVTLVPVNDKGTEAGAVAAVTTLADRHVAGIVLATEGDHIGAAVQAAADRHLPVLLPYTATANGLPTGVWSTGPDSTVTDQRLAETLTDHELTRPYLIDAGGGEVSGLTPVATQSFAAGDDPADVVARLAVRQRDPGRAADAVVISGPAELQGRLVAALQGASIDLPVLLTPDALSPGFPRAVADADGSLAGTYLSAGPDDGDARALEPTDAGRSLAAYFSALSLAADNPRATDLFGERPFGAVAGAADVRSHDAVVALVRAAAQATDRTGGADPAAVGDALGTMRLGAADGLAGAPLDFATPPTVADADVRALAATPVSPGVRPSSAPSAGQSTAGSSASLYWYAASPR
ncbi:type 1 periplasmic-binding domain-containing protein [Microlunatus ginsengisoli]|uniref:hypothetical protein n=1 Tax=Microlunatus ginsengisoli TaxID=363863 RepID=UPI0031DF92F3